MQCGLSKSPVLNKRLDYLYMPQDKDQRWAVGCSGHKNVPSDPVRGGTCGNMRNVGEYLLASLFLAFG